MRPSEYNVRLNRIISAVPHRNLSQKDFDAACAGNLSAHVNRSRTLTKLYANFHTVTPTQPSQSRADTLRALCAHVR